MISFQKNQEMILSKYNSVQNLTVNLLVQYGPARYNYFNKSIVFREDYTFPQNGARYVKNILKSSIHQV